MTNREILFRGKRDNGKWVYGDLNTIHEPNQIYIRCKDGTNYLVNPKTVGQHTGLADKNNIKIFENDIICFQNQYYVVHWNEESFQWQAHIVVGEWTSSAFDGILDTGAVNNITLGWIAAEIPIIGKMTTEVVGNVYDNPELICEKKGVIFSDRF